jgi:hypothetical protein
VGLKKVSRANECGYQSDDEPIFVNHAAEHLCVHDTLRAGRAWAWVAVGGCWARIDAACQWFGSARTPIGYRLGPGCPPARFRVV